MSLGLEFTESEAKILLESLIAREQQLLQVCESSDDDDTIADAGNDLVELRLFLNRVRDASVARFGRQVLEFSRKPL